ncbi:MAG: protease inhibitor I42 family protein [Chloroflexota bacterium]
MAYAPKAYPSGERKRRMPLLWPLLLLALLVLIVVLSFVELASEPRVVAVTGADAGGLVTLQREDTLELSLVANPATGYTWEVLPAIDPVLEQVGEPVFVADSDLLGAPGVLTLRFRAVARGEQTLELAYRRSWEEGVPPEQTFTVQVVVQ